LINNIKIKRGFMQGIIKHLAAALVLSLCLSVFSSAVYAQNQVCDPEYMDTLKQRAWMQAQREIELNANLITKPDSVLNLTCFDQFLNHAAQSVALFNKSKTLKNALTSAVSTSLVVGDKYGYVGNGFQFSLLGGSFSGKGNNLSSEVKPGPYGACKKMESVWMAVQCTNMDPNALFPDLEAFATGKDKRRNPKQCAAQPPDTKTGWGKALARMRTEAVAEGNEVEINDSSYSDWPSSGIDGYFDTVELFHNKWAPQNEVGDCADGIPTGVQVIPSSGPPYNEKICPNPGCYYTGGSSGTCEPM
jgi:hypothetical protein